MSSSSPAARRIEKTDPPTPKPPMREALIAAAFRLFLERGYEQTTVDDIVTLAGVGRRSFFRYFPSKEDVVFPDHERCLADMTAFLAAGSGAEEPVGRVCDAARTVLRMYAENPDFSVQRYRLTKEVPGLRAYELSVVWRYERALAQYLRGRFAGLGDGSLRADVIAAAVVAAHNNALRSWLRSGGAVDAHAAVDRALAHVGSVFAVPAPAHLPPADASAADAPAPAPASAARASVTPDRGGEDVVVVVSRRGAPLWQVVREIETALGRG